MIYAGRSKITAEDDFVKQPVSRRKFLKGSAVAATATAAGTIAAPAIVRAADPVTLKMQAAWGERAVLR